MSLASNRLHGSRGVKRYRAIERLADDDTGVATEEVGNATLSSQVDELARRLNLSLVPVDDDEIVEGEIVEYDAELTVIARQVFAAQIRFVTARTVMVARR